VLRSDQLGLRRQQLLVLDKYVQRRAGADKRLLLHPFEGDLSRANRCRERRDTGAAGLQGRPELRRGLNRRPARVVDLTAPLPDGLLGLPCL